MPTFRHCDLEFEVADAWWTEAGMATFAPSTPSYTAGPPEKNLGLEGLTVLLIPVDHIEPLRRTLSHGVFNDGVEPARTRVINILNGFRSGDSIPPIQVVRIANGSRYSHRLYAGAHRFYCSVAAGYSHVPAIEVSGSY